MRRRKTKAISGVLPGCGEFDKETLLAFEKETLGIYVSGHPMEAYQELWQKNVTARTSDFIVDEDGHTVVEDNSIVVVGGMITAKKGKDHPHQPADGLCVPGGHGGDRGGPGLSEDL